MVSIIKFAVYILVIIATLLIFRNLFTSTPSTYGYLIASVANFIAFGYAYSKTRDRFWLIMLASVPPMFVSDLYFTQSFEGFLFPKAGMNSWAGIHLLILSIGCFFYFKKSRLRYVNLLALVATILTNMSFGTFTLARGDIGVIAGLALQSMVFLYYLPHYGLEKKNFMFSLGSIIQFVGILIVALYFLFVSHNLQPVSLTWTDKIIAFGRVPMALGAV